MLQPFRAQAYKLIYAQIAVILLLFFCFWLFKNIQAGYSAFLGGMACVIPSVYFVKKVFSSYKRSSQKIVLDFYLAEFIKLFLSAILLVLIFKLLPVKLVALVSGYISAYLAIWLMPLIGTL
jgi:ATP synthase protein I